MTKRKEEIVAIGREVIIKSRRNYKKVNFDSFKRRAQKLSHKATEISEGLHNITIGFAALGAGQPGVESLAAIAIFSKISDGFFRIAKELGANSTKTDHLSLDDIETIFHGLAHKAFCDALVKYLKKRKGKKEKWPFQYFDLNDNPELSDTFFDKGHLLLEENLPLFISYRKRLISILRGIGLTDESPDEAADKIVNDAIKILKLEIALQPHLKRYLDTISSRNQGIQLEEMISIQNRMSETLETLTRQSYQNLPPGQFINRDNVRDNSQIIPGGFEGGLQLREVHPADLPESYALLVKTKIRNEFEIARANLTSGNIVDAKQAFGVLLRMIDESNNSDLRELRARCLANLGLANYVEGQNEKAISLFDAAYEECPHLTRIRFNKGISHILKEEYKTAEEIFEAIFHEKNDEPDIIQALVAAKIELHGLKATEEFVRQNKCDSLDWFCSYISILLQLEDFERAEDVISLAETKFPNSETIQDLKGRCLAAPISIKSFSEPVSGNTLSDIEYSKLREAFEITIKAASNTRGLETLSSLSERYSNIAAYASMLGDLDSAYDYAKRALECVPTNINALGIKYSAELNKGHWDIAAADATQLFDLDSSALNANRILRALYQGRHFRELLERFESLKIVDRRIGDDPNCQLAVAAALLKRNQRDKAIALVEGILSQYKDSPFIVLQVAGFFSSLGNTDRALSELRRFRPHADERSKRAISAEIGILLYEEEKWPEAKEEFELSIASVVRFKYLSEYIHCLYECGNISECVQFGESAIIAGDAQSRVYQAVALAKWDMGEHDEAISIVQELNEKYEHVHYRFLLSHMLLKMAKLPETRQVLERIFDENPNDAKVIAQLIDVCRTSKFFDKALDYARDGWARFPAELPVLQAISSLAVISDRKWNPLQSDLEMIREAVEASPDVQIINVKPGDGDDNGFSPIIKIIENEETKLSQLFQIIGKSGAPVESIAEAFVGDVWNAWSHCVTRSDGRVFADRGDAATLNSEYESAQTADSVTLDVVALFTLSLLDKFEQLIELFDEIYIPAHIKEFLLHKKLESDAMGMKLGQVGIIEGKMVFQENATPEGDIFDLLLVRILKFIQSDHARVIGIKPDKWDELLKLKQRTLPGDGIYRTLFTALGNDSTLFSDQMLVKDLYNSEFGGKSFGIQPFLRILLEKEMISPLQYAEDCCKLTMANYSFISKNGPIYEKLSESLSSYPTTSIERAIDELFTTSETVPDNLFVVGNAIARIWLNGKISRDVKLEWYKRLFGFISDREIGVIPDVGRRILKGSCDVFMNRPGGFFSFYYQVILNPIADIEKRNIFSDLVHIAGDVIGKQLSKRSFEFVDKLGASWVSEWEFYKRWSRWIK